MKVKAQVSQIGHASLWSPKVKATNVKPRKQDASCRTVVATTWPREIAYMYVT